MVWSVEIKQRLWNYLLISLKQKAKPTRILISKMILEKLEEDGIDIRPLRPRRTVNYVEECSQLPPIAV